MVMNEHYYGNRGLGVDLKCNCEDSKVAGSDIVQPTSLSLFLKILGKSCFSFYHLVRALTTVLAVISM